LLGVPDDADNELLRLRIRESYIEATANSDHRNMDRRIHYQSMVERILPQCRRILLNPEGRAAYDHQTDLHRQGLPGAMDYASFVNTAASGAALPEDSEANILPGKVTEPTRSEARRADEMAQARAILESLGGIDAEAEGTVTPAQTTNSREMSRSGQGSAASGAEQLTPQSTDTLPMQVLPTDLLPTEVLPSEAPGIEDASTSYSSAPAEAMREVIAQEDAATRVTASQAAVPRTAREAQQAAAQREAEQEAAEQQAAAKLEAEQQAVARQAATQQAATPQSSVEGVVSTEAVTAAPAPSPVVEISPTAATNPVNPISSPAPASTVELDHDNAPRAQVLYASRVSVGDVPKNRDARRGAKKGQRVLSSTSINALVGIVAAGLMFAILHFTDPAAAPAGAPVRITYASELQPFMERAEKAFESSEQGKGIDIQLSPIDHAWRCRMRWASAARRPMCGFLPNRCGATVTTKSRRPTSVK
jgi:FKBP-type peptidyl-prolyl cis-trans isomerase